MKLSFPATRFAKSERGFVFLTGGDLADLIIITDDKLNILSNNLKKDISHLKKPINSFHRISNGKNPVILFHSLFDYSLHQIVDGGMKVWKNIEIDGFSQTVSLEKNYNLDLEGFTDFYETLKDQPSHFTIFEATLNTFILMYLEQDVPKFAFGNSEKVINIRLDNIDNNVSFEKFIPKIIGVSDDYYLSIIAKDEINIDHDDFEDSDFSDIIRKNPDAEFFVLKFKI